MNMLQVFVDAKEARQQPYHLLLLAKPLFKSYLRIFCRQYDAIVGVLIPGLYSHDHPAFSRPFFDDHRRS